MVNEFNDITSFEKNKHADKLKLIVLLSVISGIIGLITGYLILVYQEMVFLNGRLIGLGVSIELLIIVGVIYLLTGVIYFYVYFRAAPLVEHDSYMSDKLLEINSIIKTNSYLSHSKLEYNQFIKTRALTILINITIGLTILEIGDGITNVLLEGKFLFLPAYAVLLVTNILNLCCLFYLKRFVKLKKLQNDLLVNMVEKINDMRHPHNLELIGSYDRVSATMRRLALFYIWFHCIILNVSLFLLILCLADFMDMMFVSLAITLLISSSLDMAIAVVAQNYFYYQEKFMTTLKSAASLINFKAEIFIKESKND